MQVARRVGQNMPVRGLDSSNAPEFSLKRVLAYTEGHTNKPAIAVFTHSQSVGSVIAWLLNRLQHSDITHRLAKPKLRVGKYYVSSAVAPTIEQVLDGIGERHSRVVNISVSHRGNPEYELNGDPLYKEGSRSLNLSVTKFLHTQTVVRTEVRKYRIQAPNDRLFLHPSIQLSSEKQGLLIHYCNALLRMNHPAQGDTFVRASLREMQQPYTPRKNGFGFMTIRPKMLDIVPKE